MGISKLDIRKGDIGLIDSRKRGPGIVKFFMTAPTMWHHLWRKIRGTQEEVKYYHVFMFLDKETIIEQQGKVIERASNKVLNSGDRVCVIRFKDINVGQSFDLQKEARKDLGQGYDVVNCIGKFFTWLTGIKLFARYMEYPNQEICINRVAQWYKTVLNAKFGAKTHSELTTHAMYKYVKAHPETFKIVYEGIPADED